MELSTIIYQLLWLLHDYTYNYKVLASSRSGRQHMFKEICMSILKRLNDAITPQNLITDTKCDSNAKRKKFLHKMYIVA